VRFVLGIVLLVVAASADTHELLVLDSGTKNILRY